MTETSLLRIRCLHPSPRRHTGRSSDTRARIPTARRLLDELRVPVHLVTGSGDPLTTAVTAPVTEIAGAGHYPHLTHPEQLARILASARASFADSTRRAAPSATGQ